MELKLVRCSLYTNEPVQDSLWVGHVGQGLLFTGWPPMVEVQWNTLLVIAKKSVVVALLFF